MQRLTSIVAIAMLMSASITAHAAINKPILWMFANGQPVAAIAADAEASHFLDSQKTLVMGGNNLNGVPPSWNAVHDLGYRSFDDIKTAVGRGLPPDVKGVMYDYERWPFTPYAEQRNPLIKQSADLVHAHGLMFLTAPAVDLVGVMAPGNNTPPDQLYIQLGLAGNAARYADVFDIQAQRFLNDPTLYASFVKRAAAQARAANPKVVILAGLSTQPHGMTVTADEILQAIAATRDIVDGYWFNIPTGPAPSCPTCKSFRPDIAIDVLHRLAGQ